MTFVIPMAGKGSRFSQKGYKIPKFMIKVHNKSLFEYSMESLPIEIADQLIFIGLKEHENYGLSHFINSKVNHSNIQIILLEEVTRGQAETVLKAIDYILPNEELLIYNIDTYFKSIQLKKKLLNKVSLQDGIIGAFKDITSDDKWSFAKVDNNGKVIKTTEKIKISNYALTGLYHFTKAEDFFNTVKFHISNNMTEKNEFYIAPMYNFLIKEGKNYQLDIVDEFIPLGTPEEVNSFEEKN